MVSRELRRAASCFAIGHDRLHTIDLESMKTTSLISKREIFTLGEATCLQMNSLLFALSSLPVIMNAPGGDAGASRMVEKHAEAIAFLWRKTPDATLRPELSPFPRVEMARRINWREDLIPSLGAPLGEF